jgi:hypothetical protein
MPRDESAKLDGELVPELSEGRTASLSPTASCSRSIPLNLLHPRLVHRDVHRKPLCVGGTAAIMPPQFYQVK